MFKHNTPVTVYESQLSQFKECAKAIASHIEILTHGTRKLSAFQRNDWLAQAIGYKGHSDLKFKSVKHRSDGVNDEPLNILDDDTTRLAVARIYARNSKVSEADLLTYLESDAKLCLSIQNANSNIKTITPKLRMYTREDNLTKTVDHLRTGDFARFSGLDFEAAKELLIEVILDTFERESKNSHSISKMIDSKTMWPCFKHISFLLFPREFKNNTLLLELDYEQDVDAEMLLHVYLR